MQLRFIPHLLFLVFVFLNASCLNDKIGDKCESSYYTTTVEPILITDCANSISCHVSEGNAGADFTKYDVVYAEKDEILRRISLDVSNPDFMPKGGLPLTFEEIQILNDWVAYGAKGCDN